MSLFPPAIEARAAQVLDIARQKGVWITTAESCTGGLVMGALTEIAGSSAVVGRGFVTYSNGAKAEALGVARDLLLEHGAVSEPVVRAMAQGALAAAGADLAVAVTGVAGPGGGTTSKPVGFVWFATALKGGATVSAAARFGDRGRSGIRIAAVGRALDMLGERLA